MNLTFLDSGDAISLPELLPTMQPLLGTPQRKTV
jgi:hypothetical protein